MNIKDQVAAKAANTSAPKLVMYLLPSINCKVVSPSGQVLISTDGLVEVNADLQPELYAEMEDMVASGNCMHYTQDVPLNKLQQVPAESM